MRRRASFSSLLLFSKGRKFLSRGRQASKNESVCADCMKLLNIVSSNLLLFGLIRRADRYHARYEISNITIANIIYSERLDVQDFAQGPDGKLTGGAKILDLLTYSPGF